MLVSIVRDAINVTDLLVTRPGRGEAGGDTGTPTTIASSVEAIHEHVDRLLRTSDGREVSATAKLFVDPGLDVQVRDHCTFTRAGTTSDPIEVLAVEKWQNGGAEDHIEIALGG